MGYRKKVTVYRLVFSDPEMDGLEVMAASLPLGEMMKLVKLSSSGGISKENIGGVETLFKGFAKALKGWNLENEDGTPVPATYTGLAAQDLDFALAIVNAWITTIVGVPKNLGKDSNSGSPSLEPDIPMEAL